MVFKPGEINNPSGGRKAKPLTDALRMELAEPSDFKVHRRSPRALARAMIDRAGKGDTIAWRELADRLEGKVPQAIGQSDELSPLQLIITGVPRPEPITVEHQPAALDSSQIQPLALDSSQVQPAALEQKTNEPPRAYEYVDGRLVGRAEDKARPPDPLEPDTVEPSASDRKPLAR